MTSTTPPRRLAPMALVPEPVPTLPADRAPKVSVIIPCYNYARFLPESVPSALSQVGIDPEVIIVNDASTDDSAAVADGFAARDPRVTVIHHTRNTGHVVAFNDGLAAATGEFIVRLDADDLLTPGSVARAVALFDAFGSVGLVYGHPRHFVESDPPPPRTAVRGWSVWSGGDWVAERCRKGVNCITTPEAIVRASVAREVGPLSTRLRYAQDMEYWLRTAAVSDVGRIDGADQALHRDHSASMSVNDGSGLLADLLERREVFDVLFAGPGGRLPGAAAMHDRARRSLAANALWLAVHAYDRRHTDTIEVPAMVDFALATYPAARTLPQWRALRRRQRVGERWSPLVPTFMASVVWSKARREFRHRQWTRTGV
jgi:hypothetical protein